MLMVLLFLPGTWICYGLARFGLSYLNIPAGDQMALAFLSGLVYLSCSLMRTWELWQRTSAAQTQEATRAAQTPPPPATPQAGA